MKFEKQEIFDEVKERQNYDISQLRSYQLKKGTGTWFIKKFSEQLVQFILTSIEEFKTLFFKDPQEKQQQIVFKKFLNSFLTPYLNEQKSILKKQPMPFNFVSECLKVILKDSTYISDRIQLKGFSVMDRVCEIAETTIRGQLMNSMIALYRRIGSIVL